jgi:HlyD family secretion protein
LRRIDAELAGVPLQAEAADPPDAYGQVLQQLQARQQAYHDTLAMEQAVHEKSRHDLQAARQELSKLQQTLPTFGRSAAAFDRLGAEGFYSTLAVEDKRRELLEKQQDLRSQEAVVAAAESALEASARKLAQITSSYRSDLQAERMEAQSQLQRLQEETRKLEHKSAWLALKAPQAGVIKDLATHTVGTVVSAGTVLMSLVPHEEPLQAEVYVKNEDVGFVHEGQTVKVKVAAYPFQKYGMLQGTVQHLGPDAAEQGQPAAQAGTARTPDASATPRYKALVQLHEQQLALQGQAMPLSPGMQVVAEIHLGQRSVMEYLLSPVQKAWHEAGRER